MHGCANHPGARRTRVVRARRSAHITAPRAQRHATLTQRATNDCVTHSLVLCARRSIHASSTSSAGQFARGAARVPRTPRPSTKRFLFLLSINANNATVLRGQSFGPKPRVATRATVVMAQTPVLAPAAALSSRASMCVRAQSVRSAWHTRASGRTAFFFCCAMLGSAGNIS